MRKLFLLAASVAVVATGLTVGPGSGRAASPQTEVLEPSVAGFLDRMEVAVPDRSRSYPVVAERASCGTAELRRRWRTEATGINGASRYARGEFVHTDYPFDDAGTGQLRYPGELEAMTERPGMVPEVSPRMARFGGNAADIVELRASLDDDQLFLRTTLNFVNATDATVVGIGFDLDADEATGFANWPKGARLQTPGLDLFVTLAGGCGWVTTAEGESAIDATGGAAAIDTIENTIDAVLPRSALGAATSPRMVAGAGLWDPRAGTWMAPTTGGGRTNSTDGPTGAKTANDSAVFNLLFREEPIVDPNSVLSTNAGSASSAPSNRVFQTSTQEAQLAAGTTGAASTLLHLGRLSPEDPGDPMPLRPPSGATEFTRSYRSRLDLEGLLFVGGQIVYLSRHQPYAVHVPACFDAGCPAWPEGRPPLAVNFHGGDGSHVNQLAEEAGIRVAQKLDAMVGAITTAPLGRGRRQPWWRGPGEADVLEGLHDVRTRYGTDRDRQLATGASLGGYATLRLSSVYPDLWAGAVASCPATYENSASSRAPGNEAPRTQGFTVEPLMLSLLNVPLRQISGTGDPLVRINSGWRVRDAALAAGLDFGYTEYPNSSHCFLVPSFAGGWMDNHTPEMAELLRRGRRSSPTRVRYVIDGRHYPSGAETIGAYDIRDIGLGYTTAYWTKDITLRPDVEAEATRRGTYVAGNSVGGPTDAAVAVLDVTSHGRGSGDLTVSSCGDSVGFAGVPGGGNPSVEPDTGSTGTVYNNPNRWRCQSQAWTGGVHRSLELTASKLAGTTINLAAAGIDPSNALTLEAAGDGPFSLLLEGSPRSVSGSGTCVTAANHERLGLRLQLALSGVRCTISIRP